MKKRVNAMNREERENEAQKLATMLPFYHSRSNLLKPDLLQEKFDMGSMKRATSPFNSRHCKPYTVQ